MTEEIVGAAEACTAIMRLTSTCKLRRSDGTQHAASFKTLQPRAHDNSCARYSLIDRRGERCSRQLCNIILHASNIVLQPVHKQRLEHFIIGEGMRPRPWRATHSSMARRSSEDTNVVTVDSSFSIAWPCTSSCCSNFATRLSNLAIAVAS